MLVPAHSSHPSHQRSLLFETRSYRSRGSDGGAAGTESTDRTSSRRCVKISVLFKWLAHMNYHAMNEAGLRPLHELCTPRTSSISHESRHQDMSSIAEIQERKEQEINQKYDPNRRQSDAARTLQRTYRGHRARRELKGLSLSPSARWTEVRDPTDQLQRDIDQRCS